MLNETLRLLRVFHDMKSTELAKKLNISTAYLSKIESGKVEPSIEILSKYASTFETSLSAILLFSEKLDSKNNRGPFKTKIRNALFHLLQSLEDFKENSNENISNK